MPTITANNTQELIQHLENAQSQTTTTINLIPGQAYYLDSSYSGSADDHGVSGLPSITSDKKVSIVGQYSQIVRESTDDFRLFHVESGAELSLSGLVLSGGYLDGSTYVKHGACINNHGILTISGCVIIGNRGIQGVYGGAICNTGDGATINLNNTVVAYNSAGPAGGIWNDRKMNIANCRFYGNGIDEGECGAIFSGGGNGDVDISNCVFFNNHGSEGGVFRGGGKWLVTECDIRENQSGNGGNNTGSVFYHEPGLNNIRFRRNRIYQNRSGSSGYDFDSRGVAIDTRYNYWGSNDGPSGQASGQGDSVSPGVLYEPFLTSDECVIDIEQTCDLGWANATVSDNPFDLRTGAKRLRVTDMKFLLASKSFTFTRIYRGDKIYDPNYRALGLGWTHNHDIRITVTGDAPKRTATMFMPDGGTLILYEQRTNYYEAAAGSDAYMVHGGGTYTVYTRDGGEYVFSDTTNQITARNWPDGEGWVYVYDETGVLSNIQDAQNDIFDLGIDYQSIGNHYVVSSIGRGDRGVTYEYEQRMRDSEMLPLLSNVFWGSEELEYTYDEGLTHPELQDVMIKRVAKAPQISGISPLTLEELIYHEQGEIELAVNGSMDSDVDWLDIIGSEPNENIYTNTPAPDNTPARYVEVGAINQGIEGRPWSIIQGKDYQVVASVYVSQGSMEVLVPGNVAWKATTSTTGQWVQLSINIGTASATYLNQRLQLVGTTADAQFYVASVSIKEINSDFTTVEQQRGGNLVSTKFTFAPHQGITTEELASQTTTHYFDRALYQGKRDPAGNADARSVNNQMRPRTQIDANGNETFLDWNANGRALERVTDALGNATQFGYQTNGILSTSIDAQNHKTVYAYEDGTNPRQPTLIWQTDGRNLVDDGDLVSSSSWGDILGAVPSRNERVPATWTEKTLRHVEAPSAHEGIVQSPGTGMLFKSGTSYRVSAEVYVISGTVRLQVVDGSGTAISSISDYSSGNHVWQTLESDGSFTGADKSDVRVKIIAYAAGSRFCVGTVLIEENNEPIPTKLDVASDAEWQSIGNATHRHFNPLSGDYARYVIADAANEGIESNTWDIESNRQYEVLAYVYPITGTIKAQITKADGTSLAEAQTSGTGAWEVLRISHVETGTLQNNTLRFIASGGAATFYVDSVYVLDETIIQRWQSFTYGQNTYDKGRVTEELTVNPADPFGDPLYRTTKTYGTTGHERGLLKTVTQHFSLSDTVTTTYTYDSEGRVVKTEKSSLFGTCQFQYTLYDEGDYVLGTACSTHNVAPPTNRAALEAIYLAAPETTNATDHVYDYFGRRQITRTYTGVDSQSQIIKRSNFTVYDALNRVVRTVANYVDQGSNPYDWVRVNDVWEDGSGTPINHGTDGTQNLISETIYSNRGLVEEQIDTQGRVSRTIYDDAGRATLTIANYVQQGSSSPETWVWRDVGGVFAWRLSDTDDTVVQHGPANTENLISQQVYDPVGNLVMTRDVTGQVNFTVYDALNRPVKTIRSAKAAATIDLNLGDSGYDAANDPRQAKPDMESGTRYVPDSSPDRDAISLTDYDALGRVYRTRQLIDKQGIAEVWTTNYTTYDSLGRQHLSISNYIAQGASDPADWVWSVANARWEDGAGNPIEHCTANDQNVISETIYDAEGRTQSTRNVLGQRSYTMYDSQGRQRLSISNYIAQGASDPANWVWSVANARWEDGAGTPIDHGTANDQNVIAETVYNGDGQVIETRNVLGQITRQTYDTQGRRLLSIANFVQPVGVNGPDTWSWDAATGQWEDDTNQPVTFGMDADQNIISATAYDADGRVDFTRDVVGRVSYPVYDGEGRRIRSITNYTNPVGAGPTYATPENWVFESGVWKDGAGGLTIDRGTHDDLNAVTETIYNTLGQVQETIDARRNRAYTFYDALGRQRLTIRNYVEQGASDPANWLWSVTNTRWEDGAGTPIDHGTELNQNLIAETIYDVSGRVAQTRDVVGNLTQQTYDAMGRRVQTTTNYVDGVYDALSPDEDLITNTVYNETGQVLETISARGTKTRFVYDGLGRRTQVIRAADTALATTSHTVYDISGRVLLTIDNYIPQTDSETNLVPAETWSWNGTTGRWEGQSATETVAILHGDHEDENRITAFTYDASGRRTQVTDPMGNISTTAYTVDGRVIADTDPENTETRYAYDGLRRRRLVVQGYEAQTSGNTPDTWRWDGPGSRWEDN